MNTNFANLTECHIETDLRKKSESNSFLSVPVERVISSADDKEINSQEGNASCESAPIKENIE